MSEGRRAADNGRYTQYRGGQRDSGYRTGRGRRKKGSQVPGLLITLILLVVDIVFLVVMMRSQMVPFKLLILVIVILLLLTLIVFLLTRRTGKKGRFTVGVILAVLVLAALIYGTVALGKVTRTLEDITAPRVEVTHVGVFVLTEDPAETLNDLEYDTFGILAELDRDSTDEALSQLNEHLETTVTTAEYDGIVDLVDGLYSGSCRAIVLNAAYLDVLEEIEGYEDIEDRIREISNFEVEEEIYEEPEESTQDLSGGTTFTVFISGVDSRNGLSARSRSDVNILATVNTETHQVLLVSTPRDYFVPLSISNGQKDKLTHAGIYGVQVSMDTISMLYDVDVDYYFRMDFEGFEEIVDALGGVNVYSDYAFTSAHGGYTFVQGYNYVNGAQALGFARERYAFASGDRQRGKNQMALIKAIVNKAMSPSILVNYSSVLSAADGNFDTSIPYSLIAKLVSDQLSSSGEWDIISYSVDGSNGSAVPYSMKTTAYVMIPDESTVAMAKSLMQSVLAGEIITAP